MSDTIQRYYTDWHISSAIFGILLICITGCNSKLPLEIKDFYYPIDELSEGLVYQYNSTTNGQVSLAHYWFLKAHNIDGNNQLTGQFYDHNRDVLQYFRQNITPSGAILDEYRLYTSDSIAQTIPVEVIYNNVYPFSITDTSAVYLYKLRYEDPSDNSSNTIVRNRRYGGESQWEFNGKTYSAIKIEILEQIISELDGAITIDLKGYEIYAEGIGLVYTERITRDGSTHIIDSLVDRIKMEDFEKSLNPDGH